MSFDDLSDLERALLQRSRDMNVVPHSDTPTKEPCCASPASPDDSERSSSPPAPEEPPHPDDAGWCHCGRCQPMAEAVERRCCYDVPQCVTRSPQRCITEDEYFFILCLDVEVLRVAYYELEERGDVPDVEIHKKYRYVAYRQFARWIWGRLRKGERKVIPSCAVWMIRKMFPSESYTGFKYPEL
ncbi:P2X purinoceptor 7-like [Haemaphysalis longicornis]